MEKLEDLLYKVLLEFKENFGEGITSQELMETSRRVLKVWNEIKEQDKEVKIKWLKTTFKGEIIKGPISSFTLCPHHLLPVQMSTYIFLKPKGFVMGLSKITRIVRMCSSSFSIQEDITQRIFDKIFDKDRISSLAVVVIGFHYCEIMRGVKNISPYITFQTRGYKEETLLKFITEILSRNSVGSSLSMYGTENKNIGGENDT